MMASEISGPAAQKQKQKQDARVVEFQMREAVVKVEVNRNVAPHRARSVIREAISKLASEPETKAAEPAAEVPAIEKSSRPAQCGDDLFWSWAMPRH